MLRGAGVRKGDRVVVVLPKIPEWLFCMVAALRIGAVAVPSAEQLRAKDLLYRANHSGATTVVAHAANAACIELSFVFIKHLILVQPSAFTLRP